MTVKLLGALCIVAGCGLFGFYTAYSYKRKISLLHILMDTLENMECELRFRCMPLPQLCHRAAERNRNIIGRVFASFADELDAQLSPNAERCMATVLEQMDYLENPVRQIMAELGMNLGRFDLDGQLMGLAHSKATCKEQLDQLMENKDTRMRSYQTLGLCTGAALAILFI